jgi:hypothetical protein
MNLLSKACNSHSWSCGFSNTGICFIFILVKNILTKSYLLESALSWQQIVLHIFHNLKVEYLIVLNE